MGCRLVGSGVQGLELRAYSKGWSLGCIELKV